VGPPLPLRILESARVPDFGFKTIGGIFVPEEIKYLKENEQEVTWLALKRRRNKWR